jgi:DNA-directed RNA polymerase I, II, and III subunit RPABC2
MLATVVRDKDNVIIDPLHKTIPVLTRYEKARILGERAKQLNMGAKPFVEVEDTIIDGYIIALRELEKKVIPFIIQRPLPNGGSEYWRLSDLEVL